MIINLEGIDFEKDQLLEFYEKVLSSDIYLEFSRFMDLVLSARRLKNDDIHQTEVDRRLNQGEIRLLKILIRLPEKVRDLRKEEAKNE